MDGTCSMMLTVFCLENPKGRNHLGDVGVDGG
jgi:hypothetical protein